MHAMDHSEPRWDSRAPLSRGATLRSFLVARASSIARQYVGRFKPSRTPSIGVESASTAQAAAAFVALLHERGARAYIKSVELCFELCSTGQLRATVPTWLLGK